MDTLKDFLSNYPTVVFYLAGLFGMVNHYTKKWARGEYKGSLWSYMCTDNPKSSLLAITSYIGTAAAIASTGALEAMNLGPLIGLGFTTGYTVDSVVNKTT